MTIDPFLQFQQLLASLFCGLSLGLLADTVKQLFVLLGVSLPPKSSAALYTRSLPLIRRPVRRAPKGAGQTAQAALHHPPRAAKNIQNAQNARNARNALGAQAAKNAQNAPSEQNARSARSAHASRVAHLAYAALAAARRAARALLRWGAQFLFPVLAALSLLLVSFYYNRGDFRISTVIVLLLGLLLWRASLSRRLSRPLSLAVFLLAAAGLYLRALLLLPLKAVFWLLWRFCLLPLKHALQGIHRSYRKKRSAALCARQLTAAKNGFLAPSRSTKVKEKRKENVEKKQKGARQRHHPHACDPRADRPDLHRGADHRL